MSVEVINVTKLYGTQKALDDVSFSVDKGQVVGLLGPNGAGKSTLMKIITCFLPPTSGSAAVCGLDIAEDALEVKRRVGYLPEHNPLYPDMYVREYLGFVAGIYHIPSPKERIAEMIERTGLGPEQRKQIGALSKGYRQRVGLAQALLHDPQVLILDEPTSGLDPNQLTEIRSLISETGKEKTVILSTHIMQEVEAICNRVIIINKGQIVADERTTVLQKHSARNRYSVEFDRPVEARQLLALTGVATAENESGNAWNITSGGEEDIRAELFRFAVDNNLAVISLQKEERSLEDIFQSLTRPVA